MENCIATQGARGTWGAKLWKPYLDYARIDVQRLQNGLLHSLEYRAINLAKLKEIFGFKRAAPARQSSATRLLYDSHMIRRTNPKPELPGPRAGSCRGAEGRR